MEGGGEGVCVLCCVPFLPLVLININILIPLQSPSQSETLVLRSRLQFLWVAWWFFVVLI